MKLYTASDIRAWDQFTIQEEEIPSFQLMERAAKLCFDFLASTVLTTDSIAVLAGPGNNGGDALLIASHLKTYGYSVVLFAEDSPKAGDRRLAQAKADQILARKAVQEFSPSEFTVLIDGLFGTGLSRLLEGEYLRLVQQINASNLKVYSLDMPSGMPSDPHEGALFPCIHADVTLSFQVPKLCLLSDDYAPLAGEIRLLDIGLSSAFHSSSAYELVDLAMVKSLYQPRKAFSHKGDYGRALLMGGNRQTGGAILLAGEACLRSGAGLVTLGIPRSIQLSALGYLPEAMQLACGAEELDELPNIEPFQALAIGPGMGRSEGALALVESLAALSLPNCVWDADALNLLAQIPKRFWPKAGLFTPHPGEFDRLFGKHGTQQERWLKAQRVATEMNWHILLKGSNSAIFCPDGRIFIHKGQIAALAKGGSGDVLSGILCSLLAQAYPLEGALCCAVYLHAQAAKMAAAALSDESVLSRDIIRFLPKVFRTLNDA